MNLKKGIVFSLVAFALYYLIIKGFGLLFAYLFTREYFLNLSDDYFLFADTLVYLLLTGTALFFVSKSGSNQHSLKKLFDLRVFFIIVSLAILYRFFEDPILRFDIIMGNKGFPSLENISSSSLLEQISTVLNIVVIGVIFEELFFRRIILNFFLPKYILFGIFFSSLLFSMIHFNGIYTNYSTVFLSFLFGILASIIYIKWGLLVSILFHSLYNLLWFILSTYKIQYWESLRELNFGLIYWTIIIFSVTILLFFIVKNIRRLDFAKELE